MAKLKSGRKHGFQWTENLEEVTQSSTLVTQSLDAHREPPLLSGNIQISAINIQAMKDQLGQMAAEIATSKSKMVEVLESELQIMKDEIVKMQAQS